MRSELFETESDTFLVFIEIKDDHVDFLVEFDDFFRMDDSAPREVGDVNQTIYAAKVNEYTIVGDVLNRTFEYLTFFEFGDDFSLLGFEFVFDEGFVRNDHVLVFLVDFDNLEVHGLVNKHVVVADGLDVDLRAGKKGFDAEYVNDETAFGFAFNITGDDLFIFVSLVSTLP